MCDKAIEMVKQCEFAEDWSIKKINIDDSSELKQKYNLVIPVLEREDTKAVLSWPFPLSRLRDFLEKNYVY